MSAVVGFDPNCGWCGCCGRSYYDPDGGSYWCGNCAGHVLDDAPYPWNATWFAQHGHPCPYQVGETGR